MNKRTKKGIEIFAVVFLSVAIVLCAVLIPLYFSGIIGEEPTRMPAKEKTIDPVIGIEFKKISASSLPKGQYAEFIIEYNGKEYGIKIYLLSDYAPKTVENFVKYARDGLYDGTVFYDADITYNAETGKPDSAYLQGGAYTVDQDGALVRKVPGTYYGKIKGEFFLNDQDTKNNISFIGGTIGMVRDEDDYDSADTEFFFLPYAHAEYNGYYAAFGITVDSDDTTELYAFTQALVEAKGSYPVVIKTVKIYTKN